MPTTTDDWNRRAARQLDHADLFRGMAAEAATARRDCDALHYRKRAAECERQAGRAFQRAMALCPDCAAIGDSCHRCHTALGENGECECE